MEGGVNPGLDMRDLAVSGPAVLAALTQACSQDASVLKPAEQQLHNWETQPGFYTILHVNVTIFITDRKRSCGKVMFYTCLLFCLGWGGEKAWLGVMHGWECA